MLHLDGAHRVAAVSINTHLKCNAVSINTPTSNVTLYAKYIDAPLNYTINGDGYQISGIKDKTVTEIIIPESYNDKKVIGIAGGAFRDYDKLKSVIIPDSVTSIGSSAFDNCSGLTSVTIGSGVTRIDETVFDGCDNLTNISYNGTMEKWNALCESGDWGKCTITCIDGTIEL